MNAVEFLTSLRIGPHRITAIDPETRRINTRHFDRADDADIPKLVAYAQEHKLNLYFALNPTKGDTDKKAGKEDIAKVAWLHCDVDPSGAGPLHEERAAIEARISAIPAEQKPTFIVDSGGGFNLGWKLDMACPASAMDMAEGINRGISALLGGDPGTFNADRILRLPGTTNWPDSKKRAKGRTAAPAHVVSFSKNTVSLTDAAAFFPPVAAPPKIAPTEANIDFTRAYEFPDFYSMPDDLKQRFAGLKDPVIAQLWLGQSVEGQTDNSGSGIAFSLARLLHKTGQFTDTEIAQLLYVCDYTSDYDSKADPDRELARAISRAAPPPRVTAEDEFEPVTIAERQKPTPEPAPPIVTGKGGLFLRYALPDNLRPRQMLYDNHYFREFTSLTVAPGGVGKSAMTLIEGLAMVSNKALLGVLPVRKLRVAIWNGEDPIDELHRRIAAACKHYELDASDLDGLFIQSGRDQPLVITDMKDKAPTLNAPTIVAIEAFIRANRIDVVIVDPFVSTHRVGENDNGGIDLTIKAWNGIADRCKCAVEIVHHSRKTNGNDTSVEDGRGASALLAGARSARVLNVMSDEEAQKCGIQNRRSYFKVENGKANLAPPSDRADWRRLVSVDLDNAEPPYPADQVGVVTSWAWSERTVELDEQAVEQIRNEMGPKIGWSLSPNAKDTYIGPIVARAFGLDSENKHDRKLIGDIVEQMVTAQKITRREVTDKNNNRTKRLFAWALTT